MNTTDSRSARHLVTETNPLTDPTAYYADDVEFVTLAELSARGGKVTRVRFLTERIMGRTMCDLSYIHGEIDGKRVSLCNLPAMFLVPSFKRKGELIEWAKGEGVYAKGVGLLDEGNWSTLY
jgi:hypothetical protein